MSKRASRDIDYTLNGVAIECFLSSFEQALEQELLDSTGFCDAGPRRMPGNYNWSHRIDGPNDFDAGSIDATLFAMLGSSGVASTFETTGAVAGASAPTYTGTTVLGNYNIRAGLGQLVTYNAQLQGNSALARNVA